jgi:hypothetical protein
MSLRMTPKQARNLFKQKGTTKQPSDKPVKVTPSEDAIQCAVLDWAKLVKYKGKTLSDYIHHSPNGGKRDKAQAGIFKAMGTKAGYPDLVINIARHGYHAMFIEMKRDKDQVPSNLQIQRMKMLEEEGNYCVVCKSFDHAVRELKWYMGIGLNQNRKLECGVNDL